MFGIARHAALDELRRRKRSAELTHDPPDESDGSDFASTVVDRLLRAALGALQVRDRELIALRFHAGLDTAEVAGVLGISATNAGTSSPVP